MKTSTLLATTATAALLVAATACGTAKTEVKDAAADAVKAAEGHCGAEKGAHEGSCAPGADKPAEAPPADPAPAPATP